MTGKIVFLNALPVNAFPDEPMTLFVMPVTLQQLQRFVDFAMTREGLMPIHYIRHATTLELVRKYVPQLPEQPNAGIYRWESRDVVVVITLKSPQRGAEAQQVTESDLDVRIVMGEAGWKRALYCVLGKQLTELELEYMLRHRKTAGQ